MAKLNLVKAQKLIDEDWEEVQVEQEGPSQDFFDGYYDYEDDYQPEDYDPQEEQPNNYEHYYDYAGSEYSA